jgi:lysophospholipase L1-like esterase
MMKRRVLSICLVLALCLGLLPTSAFAAAGAPVYLALGDSITTGYAPPDADGNPQTVENPFIKQVETLGYKMVNEAADGETTASLLEKLENGSIDVSDAQLITITIGGNDLMNALYGYLVESYNTGKNEEEKIDIETLKDTLASPSLQDLQMLKEVFEYLEDFSTSPVAANAFASVKSNLIEILKTINGKNPSVKILVATQYDPYKWMSVQETDLLKEQITSLKTTFTAGVTALNTSIQNAVTEAGYTNLFIVDIYSAFGASTDSLCNAYYNGVMVGFDLDFHPNQAGHTLITEEITATLFEDITLWVGNTQVTKDNYQDVLGDDTVSYNIALQTLSLRDAKITTGYERPNGDFFGIYSLESLTITLTGDSEIENANLTSGIYSNNDLTINGGGSLKTTGNKYGVEAWGSFSVDHSAVTSKGAQSAFYVHSFTVNGVSQSMQNAGSLQITPDGAVTWSGTYPLWVSGIQITDENAADVLVDGTVSYDSTTNTLTLKNADITNQTGENMVIYSPNSLNVVLIGSNTISLSEDADQYGDARGIFCEGYLNITGDTDSSSAQLIVQGGENIGKGIVADIGLHIKDCTVQAEGKGHHGEKYTAICTNNGTLVIENSTVLASGNIGMDVGENVEIDGASHLTATSVDAENGQAIKMREDVFYVDHVAYELTETSKLEIKNGVVLSGLNIETVRELYVNNVDILNAENNSVSCGSGTAVYNAETNTLTLQGAVISAGYEEYQSSHGIFADGPLQIVLTGDSVIDSEPSLSFGVYVSGDLVISGSGSLTAAGEEYGISVEDSMVVKSGNVAGSSSEVGIYVEDDMTVQGGAVSGTAFAASSLGIRTSTLTMTGGSVYGKGESAAVFASYSIPDMKAEELIILPAGYLPAGYTLQAVTDINDTFASCVPDGETFKVDDSAGIPEISGAATEITLKGEETEEPENPGGTLPPTPTPEPEELPFTDVDENDWYYEAVAYMYENGMMNGVGDDRFSPNTVLSRGMIVQVLYNLEQHPEAEDGIFSDIVSGAWYTDAVNWASSQGIVNGYGNGKFGPEEALTREQLASVLYRYAQYKGYDVALGEDTDLLEYTDAGKISSWAKDAMTWAVEKGIIVGTTNTTLSPQNNATRAQVAVMLFRFCQQFKI